MKALIASLSIDLSPLNLTDDQFYLRQGKMDTTRIFNSAKFFQPTDGEPIRSVITESQEAVVVAWYVQPGQEIPAHVHPRGQDTWTILSGKGEYYLNRDTIKSIVAGDVVIAPTGSIHGVFNHSDEALVFISVVCPSDAGYELLSGVERSSELA